MPPRKTSLSSAAATLGSKGGKTKTPARIAACRKAAKTAGRKPFTDAESLAVAIVRGGKGKVTIEAARKYAAEIVGANDELSERHDNNKI